MSDFTDEQLMRLVAEKHRPALEQIYDRYAKLVYSFAWKTTLDEQAAKEIVQTVFERLWSTKAVYRSGEGKFVNWLLTITRNAAVDHLRRSRRYSGHLAMEEAERRAPRVDESERPDSAVSRRMEKEQIRSALRHLSDSQAHLIDSLYWKGFTLREIADRNREPLGTVKSRLHQSLKILRVHLQSWEDG